MDEISQMQSQDSDIAKCISWKRDGNRPRWADVQGKSEQLRRLWVLFDDMTLKTGVLYRTFEEAGQSVLRLVTPLQLKQKIFNMVHTHRMSGHMGIRRTLAQVQSKFWWSSLRQDVERWCQECVPCQKRQVRPGRRRAPLCQTPSGAPWQRVAVDILSMPVETNEGKTCVLVITDYFTKWTEAFALKDHQALTVADTLVTEVFCRYGCPQLIHSDQGREFQSTLMKEVCKLLGITQTRTTPYHPQSDGQVERFNRTLLAMLAKVCDDSPEDWDDHLPYVLSAYRSTVHESTKCSPNMLMFGREVVRPVDLMFTPPDANSTPTCPVEYVEWVRKAHQINHEKAREHLARAAERQKAAYDRRTARRNLEVGDWVLRFCPGLLVGNKLVSPYKGPYLIVSQINPVTFRIQESRDSQPMTIHVNDLKQFYGPHPLSWLNRHVDAPQDPEETSSSSESDEPNSPTSSESSNTDSDDDQSYLGTLDPAPMPKRGK